MRRLFVPVFVVAALVLAGCGGDDEAAGPGSDYCKALRQAAADATKPTTSTSARDAAAMARAQEAEFGRILDKIVAKAPDELKDDYAAFEEFVALRFEVARNPTIAQTQASRIKDVQAKYTPAATAIQDYNKRVCQFETTTSTPAATTPKAATSTTVK